MKMTQRARRTAVALVAAAAIGGSGVAVGAAAAPGASSSTSTVSAPAARAGYAGIVRQVLPSVVLISTTEGLGSGVVLDRSGNIVTNAHVAGTATSFKVQVAGDASARAATLVGSYRPDDLAVIRLADRSGLQPARFGDSSRVQAGDEVLAVGNPLGLSGSVTSGIVSATGRVVTEPASGGSPGATLPDAIQTSAPINPGNSGGALVTTAGEVIGIPTLTAAGGQDGAQVQGIGFAIPANLARDIARQIISAGTVSNSHRAAIGAQVGTVTGQDGSPAGAGIVAVSAGSPAERAGLRSGDVIRAVGGTPTADPQALASALAAQRPGDKVTLAVTRGPQQLSVPLTLGELPAATG